MIIIAQNNQSLFDIAIQETGSIDTVMEIADANNVATTQLLEIGQDIVIPEELEGNPELLKYYKRNGIRPATGKTISNGELLFEKGLFENDLFQ